MIDPENLTGLPSVSPRFTAKPASEVNEYSNVRARAGRVDHETIFARRVITTARLSKDLPLLR
jgi:hypothetical protein